MPYSNEIIDLCESRPRSSKLQLDSVEWGIPEYRQEVQELGQSAGFGRSAASVSDIDTLDGLFDTARENAPRLVELFEDITSKSQRSSDGQLYLQSYVTRSPTDVTMCRLCLDCISTRIGKR